MSRNTDEQIVGWICVALFVVMLYYRYRPRPAGTAFGTATWASENVLRAAGMLAGKGLILGRIFGGALLRLPHYCHVLLVGGTGSGKGVSIIIPNLLSYLRGSRFVSTRRVTSMRLRTGAALKWDTASFGLPRSMAAVTGLIRSTPFPVTVRCLWIQPERWRRRWLPAKEPNPIHIGTTRLSR